MNIEIYSLISLVAVAILATLYVMDRIRLEIMKQQVKAQVQTIETLRNDIRGLYAGAVGSDARIRKLEQRNRRLMERQEQLENSNNSARPYDQAIRLVHKGASVEDIMSVCDLSRGETELIMMVHKVDKAS
jgi:hypothetical protein